MDPRAPDSSTKAPKGLAERIASGLPSLARFVRRRMGPELAARESVSDIVQSTARELLRSGHFEDRGEASFERWLQVAADHKIRNRARHWRAGRRQGLEQQLDHPSGAPADVPVDGPRASDDAMLAEERQRLARAVAQLSAEHQLVLRRVQLDGARCEEVAGELGRSPEAVRKLLTRALARLSTLLKPL